MVQRLAKKFLAIACTFFAANGLLACPADSRGLAGNMDASSMDAAPMDAEQDVAEEMLDAGVTDADGGIPNLMDVQEEPVAPPPTCTAQSCGGACCNGRCVSQTCAACDAGHTLCPYDPGIPQSNGVCVSDCSKCQSQGAPVATTCYDCTSGSPAARCASTSTNCYRYVNSGACPCASGDAGECPGPTQTCQGGDAQPFTCITP